MHLFIFFFADGNNKQLNFIKMSKILTNEKKNQFRLFFVVVVSQEN